MDLTKEKTTKDSFFTPQADADKFLSKAIMYDQEGIYLTWKTDQSILDKIIPPEVKTSEGIVFCYIINVQKPSYGPRYTEAALGVPCTCKGIQGLYWISFLLSGPGGEMATYLGREMSGMPKKLADQISIRRAGGKAYAKVVRHGIELVDVKMDITGKYPNPTAENILGDPKPNDKSTGNSIFYRFSYGISPQGKLDVFDNRFNQLTIKTLYHGFEKGTAKVKLTDSYEDPWAQLKINEFLGAGYFKGDVGMTSAKDLGQGDFKQTVPYMLASRYDKGVMGKNNQYFN